MTPHRFARGTILAAAALTIMAPAVVAPSLPAMEQSFADQPGASLLVRLAITITSLVIAVSAPVSGVVADRVGRRPLLVFGLVVYAVSGTAGYFVTGLAGLLATRALLGAAIGAVMTAVSATITDWFDGPRRASFLGLQQAFASLGGVVFLPLAGALATIDWRIPFWLYSLAAVVALCAIHAIRDRPRDTPKVTTGTGRVMNGPVLGLYALALGATMVFYMAPTQVPSLLDNLGAGPAVVGAVLAGSTLTSTLGAGLAVPNLTLRLSELAPPAWRGRVLSGLVTAIFLGQFLSPLAVQPLTQTIGVGNAFAWTGVAMITGAALAAAGTRKPNTERTVR